MFSSIKNINLRVARKRHLTRTRVLEPTVQGVVKRVQSAHKNRNQDEVHFQSRRKDDLHI